MPVPFNDAPLAKAKTHLCISCSLLWVVEVVLLWKRLLPPGIPKHMRGSESVTSGWVIDRGSHPCSPTHRDGDPTKDTWLRSEIAKSHSCSQECVQDPLGGGLPRVQLDLSMCPLDPGCCAMPEKPGSNWLLFAWSCKGLGLWTRDCVFSQLGKALVRVQSCGQEFSQEASAVVQQVNSLPVMSASDMGTNLSPSCSTF